MLRNFFSDIMFRMISLLFLHTGAILRYIFNHFTSRKRYSYHVFIINAPLLDHSGMPYCEAFNEWKGQQDERNRHACTQLNAKQQHILETLKTEGYTHEEAIDSMISAGDICIVDTNIFPRNPEYFSNRALNRLVGLLFWLSILLYYYLYICQNL